MHPLPGRLSLQETRRYAWDGLDSARRRPLCPQVRGSQNLDGPYGSVRVRGLARLPMGSAPLPVHVEAAGRTRCFGGERNLNGHPDSQGTRLWSWNFVDGPDSFYSATSLL